MDCHMVHGNLILGGTIFKAPLHFSRTYLDFSARSSHTVRQSSPQIHPPTMWRAQTEPTSPLTIKKWQLPTSLALFSMKFFAFISVLFSSLIKGLMMQKLSCIHLLQECSPRCNIIIVTNAERVQVDSHIIASVNHTWMTCIHLFKNLRTH